MVKKKDNSEEFDKDSYLFPGVPIKYTLDGKDGRHYCGICFELKAKREISENSFCLNQCISNNILVVPGEYEDEEKTVKRRYIRLIKEVDDYTQKEKVFSQIENAKNNLEKEIEKAFQDNYGRFGSPIAPEEVIEFHYNIEKLEGPESVRLEEEKTNKATVLKVERIGNYEYKTIKTGSGEETIVRRISRRNRKRKK